VRVIEVAGESGFAEEPLAIGRIAEAVLVDSFQGDSPADGLVEGQEHHAVAALAELAHQAEATQALPRLKGGRGLGCERVWQQLQKPAHPLRAELRRRAVAGQLSFHLFEKGLERVFGRRGLFSHRNRPARGPAATPALACGAWWPPLR